MKIPLEQEPFPPVTLSRNQELQLKWLSNAILDETLAEYDDFVFSQKRVLDPNKWKQVVSREDVSIYKRAGRGELGACTPDISLYESGIQPRTIYWRVPGCVGVGTLPGSIDGLLYGILAPTKTATDVRTTYTKCFVADCRVLANVINPTEADPLRSMLLRWSLVYRLRNRIVVTPRDVIEMESLGTRILPNGERIGYLVVQTVDLPGCSELTHLGLIRCKYSLCLVFRDTGRGSVDVYMRASLDLGGKLGDTLATFATYSTLISVWRFMDASECKKLAFMVRTQFHDSAKSKEANQKACPACSKGLSTLLSTRCDLCQQRVCTRCCEKRKITHVMATGDITRNSTRVCKGCVSMANRLSTRDVAAAEYTSDPDRTVRVDSQNSTTSGESAGRDSTEFSLWADVRERSDTITSFDTVRCIANLNLRDCDSDASSLGLTEVDYSFASPTVLRTFSLSIIPLAEDAEAALAMDPQDLDEFIHDNHLSISSDEACTLTARSTVPIVEDAR